jgi:hypothetical protein
MKADPNKPVEYDTYRTTCGRGRVTYRADWSPSRPWASYINGTAGQHFTTLDEARTYFNLKGMELP